MYDVGQSYAQLFRISAEREIKRREQWGGREAERRALRALLRLGRNARPDWVISPHGTLLWTTGVLGAEHSVVATFPTVESPKPEHRDRLQRILDWPDVKPYRRLVIPILSELPRLRPS